MSRVILPPCLLVALAFLSGAGSEPPVPAPAPTAAPTPAEAPAPASSPTTVRAPDAALRAAFGLDARHVRMVDVGGFPVLGSARVPDAALLEAAHIVSRMVQTRPGLIPPMVAARVRLVVMNHDEFTTDVPEHADLTPAAYWDRRARGLGATTVRPAVSCGAENLLGYDGDPYAGESILVHEFAHVVHEFALAAIDATFDRRLDAAYDAAMAAGRWAGTYASTNRHEYFAEAVQAYFDTNRQDDRQHNHVDTRAELEAYDPALFGLVDEAFGGNAWRHRPAAERADQPHLRGHDAASAPTFAWPERVLTAWTRHQATTNAGRITLALTAVTPGHPPPASIDGGTATQLRFVNRRRQSVRLVWIDTLGQPRDFGWVRARGTHEQSTYAGHTWLVMDASGSPLSWTVATDAPGLVEIGGADPLRSGTTR
jgi:hypothetical protein